MHEEIAMAHPHDSTERATSRPGWLLPLIALLSGLMLGAGIMAAIGAANDGDANPLADPTPSAGVEPSSAAPTPGTDGVIVPASCLQIADEGRSLSDTLARGVSAAQDLNALSLSSVVRDVGATQARLDELSADCRAAAGAPASVVTAPSGDSTTSVPTESASTDG